MDVQVPLDVGMPFANFDWKQGAAFKGWTNQVPMARSGHHNEPGMFMLQHYKGHFEFEHNRRHNEPGMFMLQSLLSPIVVSIGNEKEVVACKPTLSHV